VDKPLCIHCGKLTQRSDCRKLCYKCYGDRTTRALYPTTNKARYGVREYGYDPAKKCIECKWRTAGRGKRGLCNHCYDTPEIRAKHPRKLESAAVGYGNDSSLARKLPTPTRALPGSSEKIAALADRASKEQLLWHPEDGPC